MQWTGHLSKGDDFCFLKLLHKSMTVFIEDFSTHSKRQDHLYWVRKCLIRHLNTRIVINPNKIFVAVVRGVLLGHIVSEAGIEPDLEKVEVINNLKPPTIVKEVQKVLGHISWYHSKIEDYAPPTLPLTNLIRKDVKLEWTPECQASFVSEHGLMEILP